MHMWFLKAVFRTREAPSTTIGHSMAEEKRNGSNLKEYEFVSTLGAVPLMYHYGTSNVSL